MKVSSTRFHTLSASIVTRLLLAHVTRRRETDEPHALQGKLQNSSADSNNEASFNLGNLRSLNLGLQGTDARIQRSLGNDAVLCSGWRLAAGGWWLCRQGTNPPPHSS